LAEQLTAQKKGRSLSQQDIKIRILSSLYHKGGDGANAYNIQSHCVPTAQEANRFRRFLDDLCELESPTIYTNLYKKNFMIYDGHLSLLLIPSLLGQYESAESIYIT
jgi:hypothetical protein